MIIGIDIRLIGKKRTGDEVVFFNLVKNLAKLETKHEFQLFTEITDQKTLQEISEKLGIIGRKNFKITSLKCANRYAWNFWTLGAHLRTSPVDVYLTQYITPFFVPKKIKIATIIHDISFNFFPKFIKFSDLLFLKILIPLSIKRADKVIGVSEFTRDEIIKFYKVSPEKVEFIHNSIGDDFRKNVETQDLASIRAKYKLPEKFIMYLGTLQPRKNIAELVNAYAAVKDRMDGVKLVICGNRNGHNFDQRIDQAIEKNGLQEDVIFPGFIDEEDKVAIFKLAHVFVFPSLYEGFGIPILEAMSQGAPVLCSEIPSLKEVGKEGALYFDLRSLDDFSKKLYDISMDKNLRERLIRQGMARINFFSWEKSALRLLAIFEKM